MAQDNGQDFASGPSVTLLSADVSDGNTSTFTSAVDFGNPAPWGFGFELILTCAASADDWCSLEVAWSHDNSTFSDGDNAETVVSVDCTASSDVESVGAYPVRARYAKFRLNNESGGTIDGTASNTALVLTDIYGDLA